MGERRGGDDDAMFDMVECVRRVLDSDEDAARLLMQELHPLVLKVVRSHLPRRVSEEDLVQATFVKVFLNLAQYQGKVPLTHWVSRIAVNTCLNALKAERVRPELRWADLSDEAQHVIEGLAAAEPVVDGPGTALARDVVNLLLSRLSPADRLVVTLLHLEEKSVAEVAALAGWSKAVVKVRAFRARKKLHKWLKQLEKRT